MNSPHTPTKQPLLLARRYVDTRVGRGDLSADSARAISYMLRQWIRHAGPVSGWNDEHVRTFVTDERVRPATRKSRLTKIRPFVRWLVDEGVLPCDITRDMASIRIPSSSPRDLTVADVRQLILVCPDQRSLLIIVLMLQCGLRCGDVARIRIEDLDARGRRLHVRGKGGRGEPTHWIPVPDEAWGLVMDWCHLLRRWRGALITGYVTGFTAGQPAGTPLALTARPFTDQPIDPHSMSKLVGRLIRAAGLKSFPYDGVSPHALRHTCAQHMIDGGADPAHVQQVFGHAHLQTTEDWYLRRRESPALRQAVEGRTYLPPKAA